jgi:hypothetical protein
VLDLWITLYPGDFTVSGAANAFGAIVKFVSAKFHLLHYTSSFVPHQDMLPTLDDPDASWAVVVAPEPEEPYVLSDEEYDGPTPDRCPLPDATSRHSMAGDVGSAVSPISTSGPSFNRSSTSLPKATRPARERKASLPLNTRAASLASASSSSSPSNPTHQDYVLTQLRAISDELNIMDSAKIAEEINRIQVRMFLEIKVKMSPSISSSQSYSYLAS